MAAFLLQIGRGWCRMIHRSPRWPIRGQYECSICLRRYPVPWANQWAPAPSKSAQVPLCSTERVIPFAP